jgi:DNA-directed RNA polymerase specialized sigma24 family protein
LNFGVPEAFPEWFAPFVGNDPMSSNETITGSASLSGGKFYGNLLPAEQINTLLPELEAILRGLPDHYRRALVARVAFDTDEEAAEALGTNKGAYKSMLYRARRQARKLAGIKWEVDE